MRILVISDSHGSVSGIEAAIEQHPEAEHIIFLGDGAAQIEQIQYYYSKPTYHIIAGNCDWSSEYPYQRIISISGVKVFACHGHNLDVKYGLERLCSIAEQSGAKIVLFGHTHCAYEEYRNGLYIMNPGSIALPRDTMRKSYGLLDITDKGIITSIARL